tara:strand:- start:1446 stop:1883 length:438 start_codon:yes stop_codon:yes gene_type:complete
MDVFRSATLAIAVVLLIFMAMIMYYEFKVNKDNINYPPYRRDCPDYSYEYTMPGTQENVCMFNDSFTHNYEKLNNTFYRVPGSKTTPLCSKLMCKKKGDASYTPCNYQPPGSVVPPLSMYFIKDSNKKINKNNVKSCNLTLDGIV